MITQALADWMGVDPKDRRLQRALTMWSAVTASAYVAAAECQKTTNRRVMADSSSR